MLYELARTRNGESLFIVLNGIEVLLVQSPADTDYVLRLTARNSDRNMLWFRRTLGASRFSDNTARWEQRRQLTQPAYNRFNRQLPLRSPCIAANYPGGSRGKQRQWCADAW